MKIISITEDNINQEHICCAIGNDKDNLHRAQTKKEWMKERFKDGLVFKRFDERGKIFIEYMPIEKVWKPLIGKNYMVINCLWVSGQFKGKGLSKQLLNECIQDTQSLKMDGIAVVSSTKVKPFLTDKKFYEKHGFKTVDSAPPYFELLVLKFNQQAEDPRFTENVKKGIILDNEGLSFIYSNQCPFMEEYVSILSDVAKKHNVQSKIVKLKTYEEAQMWGSPFGTLGIYYNGAFKLHELMPEKRFENFIEELKKE